MDKTKLKTAMDALTDLMRSELDSEERGKFARVNRLTVLASKLQMEDAQPEDMDDENQVGAGDLYGDGMGMNIIGPAHRIAPHVGGDQAQMVREMLGAIGPQMEAQSASNRARERSEMARELNELLDARARVQFGDNADPAMAAMLTKRIKALSAQIAQQEDNEDDAATDIPLAPERDLHVVHPFGLRGHQAGEGGRLLDPGEPRRLVADGEGGGEGAAQARAEAGGHVEPVGHAG